MTPASGGAGDTPPRELYTIPASSSWFRWDEIHEEERRALPEFFGGGAGFGSASRNPRIYKEYRDFVIGKYREDPSRRLVFTDVRKALVGDVCLLRKLFSFLENSGLINFSAAAPPPPPPLPETAVAVVVEEAPAGVKIVPQPPASFLAERKKAVASGGCENGFRLPPLTSYSDVFGEWRPGTAPVCGFCGERCIAGRDESSEDGLRVCSRCSKSNSDKKGEATECVSESNNDKKGETVDCLGDEKDGSGNHASSAWTDAETLLLLEGVLKHGDDWDLIAQHVRTRNKSECIARLIQLPFGEHMLGTVNGKCDGKFLVNQTTDVKTNQQTTKEMSNQPTQTVGCTQIDGNENDTEKSIEERPLKRGRLFSCADATDTLIKQVALLSTVAGPHVAGAAADAAITALGNENPQAMEAFDVNEKEALNKSSLSNHNPQSDHNGGDQDVKMNGQAVIEHKPPEKFTSTAYRVRAAVATAMGAAAARAKLLADQEEREMELLMASIIEAQLRKIQYKIRHFEELEFIMEQEYTMVQQIKESVIDEWLKVLEQAFQAGVPRLKDNVLTKPVLNKITP